MKKGMKCKQNADFDLAQHLLLKETKEESTLRGTRESFFERSLEPSQMPAIGTSKVTPTVKAVWVVLLF